jgi:hypothetical protein
MTDLVPHGLPDDLPLLLLLLVLLVSLPLRVFDRLLPECHALLHFIQGYVSIRFSYGSVFRTITWQKSAIQ